MSGNKEAQAARNAADRRLREAHPEEFSTFMNEEHAKRGLEWKPRSTPEQRAQREAQEKEAKALARIAKIARENGLSAEAANRVLIAVQVENEVETGQGALDAGLGHPAKETVVDSGSYADDIVNERSAPVGGW